MNSQANFFTFEITNKYVKNQKTEEINYENGYHISYPYGNYKRHSLTKIKKEVKQYKEYPRKYLGYETIAKIKNSALYKRRTKTNTCYLT